MEENFFENRNFGIPVHNCQKSDSVHIIQKILNFVKNINGRIKSLIFREFFSDGIHQKFEWRCVAFRENTKIKCFFDASACLFFQISKIYSFFLPKKKLFLNSEFLVRRNSSFLLQVYLRFVLRNFLHQHRHHTSFSSVSSIGKATPINR